MATILITGGVKRIGAAIARDLASHGHDLVLQYVSSREDGEALAEELAGPNGPPTLIPADLTIEDDCRNLFTKAREAKGRIDVLVNNASLFEPDTARKFERQKWDSHFAIHLVAPHILAEAMAEQKDLEDGLIVNMIDQRVWRLNPNFHSYTLSKSALWTATKTLAQSLAPQIRVNAIGPGPTLQNARQTQEDFQHQLDGLLLKRGPQLEEFGAAIRFMWDAKSMTGQMLALDGGQHLAWETPDLVGINE